MADIPKRIALVYDRINKWGGAERVLLALHQLFPLAPLYTSVYDQGRAPWAKVFPQVIPSFLNRIPYAKKHHELIPFLTPVAFESFNFAGYDAVISVTSADAKGIVTRPSTFHFCYCLTPTRYLWSHRREYYQHIPLLLKPFSLPWFKYLKIWDQIASHRPDTFVAISHTVKDRINKYYQQDSQVIYPPANTDFFTAVSNDPPPGIPDRFFLYNCRLVSYKNPELVISAFKKLNLPLVVVGQGSINWGNPFLTLKTKAKAGKNIIHFSWLPESQLAYLYQHCQALIYFHEEDFGIVPIETMAAGKPVIGLNKGGVSETVVNGLTGVLIDEESESGLINAVKNFKSEKFDPYFISNYARKFSNERFAKEFVKVFTKEWNLYKRKYRI